MQKAQVGKELLVVHRSQHFHRLELDREGVVHQQVHPQSLVEAHPVELEWHRFLPFHPQATLLQRPGQHHLVNRLQQPWSQLLVNMERRIDRYGRYLLDIHVCLSPPSEFTRRREVAKIAHFLRHLSLVLPSSFFLIPSRPSRLQRALFMQYLRAIRVFA